jgi:hypothetical protein
VIDFWITPFDWWSGTPLALYVTFANFLFWPALFLRAWLMDEWEKRRRRRRKAQQV